MYNLLVYCFGFTSVVSAFFYLMKLEHNNNLFKKYHLVELLKKKTDDKNKIKELEELQQKLLECPHFP